METNLFTSYVKHSKIKPMQNVVEKTFALCSDIF